MSEAITIVDAHAHVHACFAPEDALEAAWDHFAAVAADRDFTGVLMLAEPVAREPFSALRAETWTRWNLESGPERVVRRARRVDDRATLWLASGFQVTTREGLEVLCLGCEQRQAAAQNRVLGPRKQRPARAQRILVAPGFLSE